MAIIINKKFFYKDSHSFSLNLNKKKMNPKATSFLVLLNGSIENAQVCFIYYLIKNSYYFFYVDKGY